MWETLPEILHWRVLLPWLCGMAFGVFVGSTPGLTATMAVALLAPVGFKMDANAGMALVIGVSFTAIFAGDLPATYLRIPGTPASAAATLDGYALARRGRGHFAVTLDLLCSALGGLVGVALLILVAPVLAQWALQFSDFERFWLAVLGLSFSALVSQGNRWKGAAAAALGVLLSTIGSDVRGSQRFTLGIVDMIAGLDFIAIMIGLFGLGEVLRNIAGSTNLTALDHRPSWIPPVGEALRALWRNKLTFTISSLVGTLIGALPGAGADIAAWGAYGLARRTSRQGDQFGQGCEEGVIAPTSANNAAVAGAWIPALVFGIPGDAVTAIVLGALTVYGIKAGPNVFVHNAHQINAIFAIALLTQVLLIPAGLIGLWAFGAVLRLPRNVILGAVVMFSLVGSYSLNNRMFDVYVMCIAGLAGFYLESRRVPLAPLVLGLILGRMLEENLRNGLISHRGDATQMFTRPVCMMLVAALAAIWLGPLLWSLRKRMFQK